MSKKPREIVFTDSELRQIEILKKYHQVDEVNRIVHVKLHYETVDELLCLEQSTKEKPYISHDIMDKMDSILSTFPKAFKLDLDVQVDDYGEYCHDAIMDSFADIYELEFYRTEKQNKKTWIVAAALLFGGCFLLVLLNILYATGAIGESLGDRVLDYFLDTVACVLMWECVSQLFLYPAEFVVRNSNINRCLHAIRLLDKKNDVLAIRDSEYFANNVVSDSRRVKAAKAILLSVGTIHIILACIGVANYICELNVVKFENAQFIVYTVSVALIAIFEIIYGIGSINTFLGRHKFKKWILPMSIILIVLYVFHIICVIVASGTGKTVSASIIASAAIGLVVTIANMIAYHILKKDRKRNKSKNK